MRRLMCDASVDWSDLCASCPSEGCLLSIHYAATSQQHRRNANNSSHLVNLIDSDWQQTTFPLNNHNTPSQNAPYRNRIVVPLAPSSLQAKSAQKHKPHPAPQLTAPRHAYLATPSSLRLISARARSGRRAGPPVCAYSLATIPMDARPSGAAKGLATSSPRRAACCVFWAERKGLGGRFARCVALWISAGSRGMSNALPVKCGYCCSGCAWASAWSW